MSTSHLDHVGSSLIDRLHGGDVGVKITRESGNQVPEVTDKIMATSDEDDQDDRPPADNPLAREHEGIIVVLDMDALLLHRKVCRGGAVTAAATSRVPNTADSCWGFPSSKYR